MAGMDDNITVIGDWAPPNPSPRTFISNFFNEEFGSRSFSDLLEENGGEGSLLESEKQKKVKSSKEEEGDAGFNFSSNIPLEPSLFDVQRSNSRGGLAERMAARAGFNPPTINTARIRSANMASSSSDILSPYLTIPPGLSPTTLLDSPVFLSNSMAQPSPTTGKIQFAESNNTQLVSVSALVSVVSDKSKDDHLEDIGPESFAFKLHLNPNCTYFSNPENKDASAIDRQRHVPNIEVSIQQDFNFPTGLSESSDRKDSADDIMFGPRASNSFMGHEQSPPYDDQPDGEEPKGEFSSMTVSVPAEDGYNWRKYGQKHVKGSEYPRSYYKCTHPNCQVKKKVERSHEGHITEIIYKGAHYHPKPPPNRRSAVPSSHPFNDTHMDGSEQPGLQANFDGKPMWASDGMEATSTASVAAEFGVPSTPVQTQDGSCFESPEAIDVSSTLSNDEEEDDRATHGSVSLGCDGEGDETESKRRKLDTCAVEMSAASRTVREPRVVVQTTSEVDILDDGYRWRKYGQKVVKGNPNPRSYYKCTNPGCAVRKHVERASHDLKSVITTYEGKHNHDVPAARNSSHSSSGPSTTAAAAAASSSSQPHSLHRRPEPTQDGLMRQFSLPGREQQLGPATGFSFGMASLGINGFGPMGPVKMPVLGSLQSFLGHRQASSEAGFMVPKGEPKEEPVTESGLPISIGVAAYHQLMMSRLPLGPQL